MKALAWAAACILLSSAVCAETLSVPPYPSTGAPWKKITDKRDARMVWIEWIPASQSENDIHDILTEQIFYVQKGRDPADFVRDLEARLHGACAGLRVNGPKAGNEGGHVVAYAQAYCVGAGNTDADIFIKAIAGHDALYVVQREFRRPAVPGAVAGARQLAKVEDAVVAIKAQKIADDYLASQVKLCDGACGR